MLHSHRTNTTKAPWGFPIMNIIYLAHSSERIHLRTAFSILSCFHVHGGRLPCPLLLYTDQPSFYEALAPHITIIPLSPHDIAAWIQAANQYKNVAKAEIFRCQDDSFFFFDGDTVLLRPLGPLFRKLSPSVSIMQKREYLLGKRPDFASLVADPDFPAFTARTRMYNSGILGVHRDNLPIIRQVRDVVLSMRAKHHIRTPEQLTDGTLLAQKTRILTAPAWIYHYWQDKAPADALIDRNFAVHGLSGMTQLVLSGQGAPLFRLGIHRHRWLDDLQLRIRAKWELFRNR